MPTRSEDGAPVALLVVLALVTTGAALGFLRTRRRGERQPRVTTATGPALPQAAASPPDSRRGWTAEIEWRRLDGESRFCAIARPAEGAGESAVAQSQPLEWPPKDPESVGALTDAPKRLEASLVAAGWKPLAPGGAWYARRFAWEPVAPAPATEAKGAPEARSAAPRR